MSTSNTTLETPIRDNGETEPRRSVLRAVTFVAAVIACHLPLVALHFRHVWLGRPHYQFFPLLLAGIAWLLWKRWPQWTATAAAPRWSNAVLACGLVMLSASTLFWSSWLAAVALVLSIGGLIGRYAVPGQWRDWLPVWLVMWLIVPPPLGLDFRLISWLQSSTSRMASLLLDLLGVLHLMEGHVLVLPGHRMLVDEACSGVNSVLVLLVLTAMFVVSARRPLLWSALLLASSVAWAWAGNTVRVATIAIAQAWYELDLSTGWQHELLGYVTISLALVWLASTDYCLAFLLRPIALRTADVSGFASRSNALTRAWNWCVGADTSEHRRRKRRGQKPVSAVATGGLAVVDESPRCESGETTGTLLVAASRWGWLAAFGLLAVLQLAGVAMIIADRIGIATADRSAMPAVGRATLTPLFQRNHMPENLNGWSLVDYELTERAPGADLGHFSNKWRFRRGTMECLV
jgi:exosortase